MKKSSKRQLTYQIVLIFCFFLGAGCIFFPFVDISIPAIGVSYQKSGLHIIECLFKGDNDIRFLLSMTENSDYYAMLCRIFQGLLIGMVAVEIGSAIFISAVSNRKLKKTAIFCCGLQLAIDIAILSVLGIFLNGFPDTVISNLVSVSVNKKIEYGVWANFGVHIVALISAFVPMVNKTLFIDGDSSEKQKGEKERKKEKRYKKEQGKGTHAAGEMIGESGEYASAKISFKNTSEVIIGRDPELCNVRLESLDVGPVHCVVRFNRQTGKFFVMDYSKSGVYLNEKVRLPKEKWSNVGTNATLRIGDTDNIFRLR